MIGNARCFGSGTLPLKASINPTSVPGIKHHFWSPPLICASNGFEFAIGEPHHFQQQPAVAKPGDLGLAEGACLVMDRRLDDLEILFGGTEDQVEVAERIEVAEIATLPRQRLIILSQQNL